MRLLDLFCCQGGASEGYRRAGFDVVGVDIAPQPRYPFEFHQGDALAFLAKHGHEFDAVHASPPCQTYSALNTMLTRTYDALVPQTRAALIANGKPWVMENVPGAPMPGSLILCGTEFGLNVVDRKGVLRWLRRHRLFESSEYLAGAGGCTCAGRRIAGVYGNGGEGGHGHGYKVVRERAAELLGTPWMDQQGMAECLPPVYTEFVGEQLIQACAPLATV